MANAAPVHVLFEDIGVVPLRMLGVVLGVAINGRTRAQLQGDLANEHARYTADRRCDQLTRPQLAQWAELLGITINAETRAEIVNHIANHGRPPAVPAAPAPAPAPAPAAPAADRVSNTCKPMESLVKLESFANIDIRETFVAAFKGTAQELAVWNFMEPTLQLPLNDVTADPVYTAAAQQRAYKLRNELLACLSETIRKETNKAITANANNPAVGCRDTPQDVYKFLLDKFVDLGDAEDQQREMALDQNTWKNSGLGFHEWVLLVKSQMEVLRDRRYNSQEIFDRALRTKITKNVNAGKVPNLSNFLNDQKVLRVTDPAGDVNTVFIPGIISRMRAHLTEISKSDAAASEVFCADYEEVVQANLAEAQAKNKTLQGKVQGLNKQLLESTLPTNGDVANDDTHPQAYYQGDGDWCKHCETFYKRGYSYNANKWRCRHKQADCRFWKKTNGQGSQYGENGNSYGADRWKKTTEKITFKSGNRPPATPKAKPAGKGGKGKGYKSKGAKHKGGGGSSKGGKTRK